MLTARGAGVAAQGGEEKQDEQEKLGGEEEQEGNTEQNEQSQILQYLYLVFLINYTTMAAWLRLV